MDIAKLSRAAESLRKSQRAELNGFENKPVDAVYFSSLPSIAVLNIVSPRNTTFLFGRKEALSVCINLKPINESSQISEFFQHNAELDLRGTK